MTKVRLVEMENGTYVVQSEDNSHYWVFLKRFNSKKRALKEFKKLKKEFEENEKSYKVKRIVEY